MLVLKLLFLMETKVCGNRHCMVISLSLATNRVDSGMSVQMSGLVVF